MSNLFSTTSKEIADRFLQSVVFIDDKAFDTDAKGGHVFDAYKVTKAFAAKQKICAVYKPKTVADIDDFAKLSKKADVTVLDWQIDIPLPVPDTQSEEDVVANDDPRGEYTLQIIREILSDPTTGEGSLKLILVYTGETNLPDITAKIFQELTAAGLDNLKEDFCEICTDNIKILVIAKADPTLVLEGRVHEQFKLEPKLQERVKSYEELPEYIIQRFAEMTTGLLPNFTLRALTIIRENTFRFIKLYHRGLDHAYLAHRLLLPDQDDAKEFLVELFAHSIHSLLVYHNASETVDTPTVLDWIETQILDGQIKVGKKQIKFDNAFVRSWIRNGFLTTAATAWKEQNHTEPNIDDLGASLRKLKGYFLTDDKNDPNDRQFSVLTHHKSIFKPTPISPKLSLGTVVRGNKTGYWVCIQQRCDSVRIDKERRFLFLPLEPLPADSEAKYHFVTEQGIRLKLNKKSYELRTIKFIPRENEHVIKANTFEGKFVFEPYYKDGRRKYNADNDEVYEWIFDLKELHAQRIAIEFANEISRVGLDEAEWLRRGDPK